MNFRRGITDRNENEKYTVEVCAHLDTGRCVFTKAPRDCRLLRDLCFLCAKS